MNLRVNIALFLTLLVAFIYGDESLSIGYHEDYYVMRLGDVIVAFLVFTIGLLLMSKIMRKLLNNEKER